MKQLPKRLIAGLLGTVGFATAATALTLVVDYKPWGVPDHRRAEYEEKVAKVQQRTKLLEELQDKAKPIAVVPSKTHDFGMLDPHTTAVHSFEIENKGEHPLVLQVHETSCKCTVGKLDHDLLGPGESTKVTMTWNTGYKAEEYQQTATLVTNDPLNKHITLTVKGEVRAELIAPDSVKFKASNPAETTEVSFVVFSQLWDDFTVTEVKCGLQGFEWHAEPIAASAAELGDFDAKSAWRVRVFAHSNDYGEFGDEIELTMQPDAGGDAVVRTVAASGRVRAPISFISPDIHKHEGLDIGTLTAGKEHQFHLVVRCRGNESQQIDVLDVQPEQLQASLQPLSKPGNYRLTLTVPADCPSVVFNIREKHGYVQVGDPQNERFSNWFPLYGAVVTLQK